MSAASSSQAPHLAGVTYVVIPMSGLATFEQALPLVAGHDLVEQPLLGARVIQVVVDNVVAQRRTRDRPTLERFDRFPQRRRKPIRIRLVRVALERRR